MQLGCLGAGYAPAAPFCPAAAAAADQAAGERQNVWIDRAANTEAGPAQFALGRPAVGVAAAAAAAAAVDLAAGNWREDWAASSEADPAPAATGSGEADQAAVDLEPGLIAEAAEAGTSPVSSATDSDAADHAPAGSGQFLKG